MALATAATRLIHPCMAAASKNPRGAAAAAAAAAPPCSLPLHYGSTQYKPLYSTHFLLHSVDVSKDDKPLDAAPPQAAAEEEDAAAAAAADFTTPLEGEEDDYGAPKLDPRRFEEQFVVLNTGVHECRSCGYLYDQAAGDPSYPVPPGLPFAKLPDDWRCPTCGAAQSFFDSKSIEIAGFAQNQQFGLGGNSLTSGQKTLLIYGSLLVGFAFFLSGYFLQ